MSDMLKLWKFEWYADYAFIGGIFKATDEEIHNLMGKRVILGEAEGKHSDIYGHIENGDITLISDNPVVVNEMIEFGYNPLEHLDEEEDYED